MKRFFALALAAVLALGVSSVVYANVCAFDPVPAATLLFPFVQLDFNNPVSGDTTLFAITNVSNEAQIAHVTIWTDFSFAILDFNVVLSGYDVQTMNIRDILVLGDLPNTGTYWNFRTPPAGLPYDFSAYINPIDGDPNFPSDNNGLNPSADGPISPYGAGGDADDYLPPSEGTRVLHNNGRCPATSPAYPNYPIMPDSTLATLQFYLTYVQYLGDFGSLYHTDCYSDTLPGDAYQVTPDDWWQSRNTSQPSWMYITVDVVENCNRLFPSQRIYWTDEARYDNVLIGDVMWVNTDARFSEADTAVHIEADVDIAAVVDEYSNLTPQTFYNLGPLFGGSFSGGFDYREPLPNAWAFRYMGAGTDDIDTWIRVWKNWAEIVDIEDADGFYGWAAVDCDAYTYYAWDEDENYLTTVEAPWSAPGVSIYVPNLLPLETQEVSVDQFNTPDSNGWMLFIWPDANYSTGDLYTYYTWMGVKYGAYGQFSAAMSGAVMANSNCFPTQDINAIDGQILGINYDYVWPIAQ